jgi:signal transduction histidine kinase
LCSAWRLELQALGQIIGQFFVNAILRSRAEGGLLEYQQRLRALAAEMSLAEERVRRRAAVDLHDGSGQYLAVARIKLGQLLASKEPSMADIEAVRELIDSALKQTRYIISDLSPSVLYELGLVPAIEWLAERTAPQAHLEIDVTADGAPDGPDEEARVIMFQVVRELLANIVKHAKATRVGIHISWHDGHVESVVSDNGVGFRKDRLESLNPEQGGFGLFSIRERLRAMRGNMTIDSSIGMGTRISVSCPLVRRAPLEPAMHPETRSMTAATPSSGEAAHAAIAGSLCETPAAARQTAGVSRAP